MGHELYIFEKKIFKADDKRKYIIDNKIDVMIDDNLDVCNSLKDICKVIYFKDAPNYENKDKNIITIYNWGEIYRFFKEVGE